VTARRLTAIATGPSGGPEELEPLRVAGHEVVIGRPLDMAGRTAYTEPELIEQCRVADVVLASHLERVTPAVMEHPEHHNIGLSEAGRRANLRLALEQFLAVGRPPT
jgi:hypothetical protein